MTLDELERLARAATLGPWYIKTDGDEECGIVRTIVTRRGTEVAIATTGAVPDNIEKKNAAHVAACSPERILAMIECIRAADAMLTAGGLADEDVAYESVRAKLDEAMK